jgi:tRNA (cytidine/uridine-2'-O-)-methyltransferase
MLHIGLYQLEIPPNTGNIMRLCVNGGFQLHLIHPLGFNLDDKRVCRAGLDYRQLASVKQHHNNEDFFASIGKRRLFVCSTKGKLIYADAKFKDEDVLLFGPETRGLPDDILQNLQVARVLRIPMKNNSRSLNLSNAVAIISYEAWRKLAWLV